MMKNLIFKFAAAVALTSSVASCTEITNYPDGRLDFDEIWTNDRFVMGYLNTAYLNFAGLNYIQAYGTSGTSFLDAATDNAYDVDDVEGGQLFQWNNATLSTASNPLTRLDIWSKCYKGIYYCNILIANIPTATLYDDDEAARWMAEAHGLRALYYLQLIKNYGGVPIILDTRIDENGNEVPDMVDNSDYDYSKVTRASYATVVRQILKDCQYVLDSEASKMTWRAESDDNIKRINKGIASAIMSEAALFAASPLNYDASDPNALDWAEAAEITKTALDNCIDNGYKLFTTAPTSSNNENELAANAYDHMFLQKPNSTGTTDPESILYTGQASVWGNCTAPILDGFARAGSCPSQELVDSYETLDGKAPILGYYDDAHLQPIINADANYDDNDPYVNRDPRLRSTIYYNSCCAHMGKLTTPIIYTGEGGKHQISTSSVLYTRTGYYLHKYFNITSNRSGNSDGYFRVFRLAELYLNYAEAAAEAGAPVANVLAAVKPVRDRVGMPQWSSDITNDRSKLIERIHNERRVEFAFEDNRFYDLRRWKTLDQTSVVTGMRPVEDITTETVTTTDETTGKVTTSQVVTRNLKGYQRFSVGTSRATESKFLRLPIPIAEQVALETATGLEFQNSGW